MPQCGIALVFVMTEVLYEPPPILAASIGAGRAPDTPSTITPMVESVTNNFMPLPPANHLYEVLPYVRTTDIKLQPEDHRFLLTARSGIPETGKP